MSVHVTSYIWKHSKQSGTRLVMMLSIADRCDDDGGCFPGQRDLADRGRLVNTKSVSGIVNQLSSDGELTIVRRNGHSNYYFAREYCIANGVVLEEKLKEYGLKGPLEIVGGWTLNDPPADDDPTPPQTVDDPPADDDPTPPQTVDDPPADADTESSVNRHLESSVESSVESSSSKSKGDDDDFNLTDKEHSILVSAFGGLTKVAKDCLKQNRDLTIAWSEYAAATRNCYDDDDPRFVKVPSRYIFAVVRKGEPVPEIPVEDANRKFAREMKKSGGMLIDTNRSNIDVNDDDIGVVAEESHYVFSSPEILERSKTKWQMLLLTQKRRTRLSGQKMRALRLQERRERVQAEEQARHEQLMAAITARKTNESTHGKFNSG